MDKQSPGMTFDWQDYLAVARSLYHQVRSRGSNVSIWLMAKVIVEPWDLVAGICVQTAMATGQEKALSKHPLIQEMIASAKKS